jgi:hypothetical protein
MKVSRIIKAMFLIIMLYLLFLLKVISIIRIVVKGVRQGGPRLSLRIDSRIDRLP